MGDSVAALVEDYLDHLRVERGASAHTLSGYGRDLRRYQEYLSRRGVDELAEIGPELPADFAAELRAGRRAVDDSGAWKHPPLADASIARAVVAVRGLHRFALAEGASVVDPAASARPPRPPRRLPKALSVDDVQRLLAAPEPETPLGLRDRALLEVLYGTGARISEAVGLDVDDVTPALDPDAGPAALRLFGKGNKERIVPFGSYAVTAVAAYLVRARPGLATRGRGTPALFVNTRGARLSRQSAWAVLQAAAATAGITAQVSPHTLRHSYATHLLDGGADVRVVQELLGHASVTTTQIYTLVTVDHLREVYLSAHPRAR